MKPILIGIEEHLRYFGYISSESEKLYNDIILQDAKNIGMSYDKNEKDILDEINKSKVEDAIKIESEKQSDLTHEQYLEIMGYKPKESRFFKIGSYVKRTKHKIKKVNPKNGRKIW